ncbi:dynein light intermediate chain-domain-containing protein [Kockiozyma suomiensis]|uniref:dynein light intermediate chain-domain-containing protein n=1 Tax=Kockiozyma suomiensis TaxID=1337062 RepID=UPI0033442C64
MAEIWTNLLDSALTAKSATARTILLIGGSAEIQRSFITQLVTSTDGNLYSVKGSHTTMQNEFAIGYLYLDIYDREQEDLILRLNVYTMPKVFASYAKLLVDILRKDNTTFENLFVIFLCDWVEPRRWIRDLAQSIIFLRDSVFSELDQDTYSAGLQRCSERYKKLTRVSFAESFQLPNNGIEVEMPLGKGEFDAPLGVDFMVAMMNSERIDILERQFGRKDDEFDFIQQFLRTILLKHGASLIYLSSDSKTLFSFVFYLLSPSIESEHSKDFVAEAAQQIKPNVIQRDSLLIPSGWDSWSKILVIKEDFDVEGVSGSWQHDVLGSGDDMEAVIEVYEDVVYAFGGAGQVKEYNANALEVEGVSAQVFLRERSAELNSIETKTG